MNRETRFIASVQDSFAPLPFTFKLQQFVIFEFNFPLRITNYLIRLLLLLFGIDVFVTGQSISVNNI